jgi:hypothetical protein
MGLCDCNEYMATAKTGDRKEVRLNNLDWKILGVMSDGRRYTQAYLYNDVEELEDESADWIRKRVSHLYANSLIEKVGTSSMYVISDLGEAALRIQDDLDQDLTPRQLDERIRAEAAQSDTDG